MMLAALEKLEIHDLTILGCYLHPIMRDMTVVRSAASPYNYKSRIEALMRTLYCQSTNEMRTSSNSTQLGNLRNGSH